MGRHWRVKKGDGMLRKGPRRIEGFDLQVNLHVMLPYTIIHYHVRK